MIQRLGGRLELDVGRTIHNAIDEGSECQVIALLAKANLNLEYDVIYSLLQSCVEFRLNGRAEVNVCGETADNFSYELNP